MAIRIPEYTPDPPPTDSESVLVLAAHPDDEAIGAWGWLSRWRGQIILAFLTDGVPPRRWRPPAFGNRTSYRRLRRFEACALWRQCAPRARLIFAPFPDQQLSLRLPHAAKWLACQTSTLRLAAVLAPAYEGGHPDHDAANLLAAHCALRTGTPAWEYALYTACDGAIVRQCFPGQPQWTRTLTGAVAASKQRALAAYASQASTLAPFSPTSEAVRPLPPHQYCRPALAEPAVYELWQWPWNARALAHCYADFSKCAFSS